MDEQGFPVSLALRYVIDRFRGRRSTNTIKDAVAAIGEFYRWAHSLDQSFDPENRLRVGPLLDGRELSSLAEYVRAGGRANVIPLAFHPLRRAAASGVRSNADFNNRLIRIRDFVCWAAVSQMAPPASQRDVDRFTRQVKAHLLTVPQSARKKGLPPTVVEKIQRVLHPDSGDNPFNRPVRMRNRLIFRLLLETGIRRGELCALRLEDFVATSGTLPLMIVVKRKDSLVDTRKDPPQVKTRGRRIPLGRGLFQDYLDYIQKHRGRQKHPFVFVSHRGGVPINKEAVNDMFFRLKNAILTEEPLDLTPHTMRRTFNDQLWSVCREQGLNDQQVKDISNYLGGWTEQSNQAATYNRRAVEESAMEIVEHMHVLNDKIAGKSP